MTVDITDRLLLHAAINTRTSCIKTQSAATHSRLALVVSPSAMAAFTGGLVEDCWTAITGISCKLKFVLLFQVVGYEHPF